MSIKTISKKPIESYESSHAGGRSEIEQTVDRLAQELFAIKKYAKNVHQEALIAVKEVKELNRETDVLFREQSIQQKIQSNLERLLRLNPSLEEFHRIAMNRLTAFHTGINAALSGYLKISSGKKTEIANLIFGALEGVSGALLGAALGVVSFGIGSALGALISKGIFAPISWGVQTYCEAKKRDK